MWIESICARTCVVWLLPAGVADAAYASCLWLLCGYDERLVDTPPVASVLAIVPGEQHYSTNLIRGRVSLCLY